MCILIEISIKIYFMDIAAGNGPKVQSARAPATNRRQAHETSTRTHPRDNTHTAHMHRETSARTHARDNTHTAHTHTRRRRARTLVTTRTRRARTRRARTRYVNATHARESTRRTVTHAHETSTRTHARENTPTARTHAHETSMQSTLVNTRARRPRANASTHARIRARCGKR